MNKYLIILLFFLFILPHQARAAAPINPDSFQITVSATIGEPRLNLFGYSSPNSLVRLFGQAFLEETIAEASGYFFFKQVFLLPSSYPPAGEAGPELCLMAFDSYSRTARPICLPPLPQGPWEINVGPVILPPTISIRKNSLLPWEQVKASGLTLPNADLSIFLANDSLRSSLRSRIVTALIPPVFTYNLPEYRLKSDENGYFEFNLPSYRASSWKMFAAAKYEGKPGAASNQLSFSIQSWWEWLLALIISYLKALLALLRPYLWLIIIAAEITLLISLLRRSNLTPGESLRNTPGVV